MAPAEFEARANDIAQKLEINNPGPDLYRSEPGDLQMAVIHSAQGPNRKGIITALVATTTPGDPTLVSTFVNMENPPEGLDRGLRKRNREALRSGDLEIVPFTNGARSGLDELDAPASWEIIGGGLGTAFEIRLTLNNAKKTYTLGGLTLKPLAEYEPVPSN